jgi:AraC-like DNA-binding protein
VLCRQLRGLTTPAPRVLAVEFSHAAPPGPTLERFRKALDAPVRFGAERTQLVLPAAALTLPMRSADPTLAGILARTADAALAALPTDARLASQVARALHPLLRDDRGHIDEVAARLGMPARSLQRRLRDEGTSFQDVREDVRRTLAERYLQDGLAIAEVAFLVGYSEPSAFFRAFKRWTGATPIQHIAAARALAPA